MNNGERSLWPFSERNGVNASEYINELLAPPRAPLALADLDVAYLFAHELASGYLNDNLHASVDGFEPPRPLESINQTSLEADSSIFYLDYFKTAEGRADASRLGLAPEEFEKQPEHFYALAVLDNLPNNKMRQEIASNSLNWYKAELARRLTLNPGFDALQQDSPAVRVNFAPDRLLAKFAELQAYRRFYHEARAGLKHESDSRLVDAGRLLVDVHLARANNLVAGLYPQLVDLASQIDSLPASEKTSAWRAQLEQIAPVAALALDASDDFAPNFARRLDLVRNGAERYETGQNFSPISHELGALALELADASDAEMPTSQLAPEVLETLKNTHWDASQFAEFLEAILADWEILSEEKIDWSEASARSGRASDDKWQVVISPKVKSLSVDGKKKIMKVPEKFDRTLAKSLPVAAHELTHVIQHEFAAKLAEKLPLAKIKGRRYVTSFEMGGIISEREILAKFGENRPVNLTYLVALQAKQKGANQTEATRAFASASSAEDRYASAGKNILRHYRHGGYDSQALDYLEQELIRRPLADWPVERGRALAIAGGSFNLAEAAALHRFGLLEIPSEIDKNPAETVWKIFKERFGQNQENG